MTYLAQHWLAFACLLLAGLLGTGLLLRRLRAGRWSLPLLLGGAALALLGFGGLGLFPGSVGMVMALAALGVLAVMLAVVIATGLWSAPLGYLAAAVLLVGLGGWALPPLADGLRAAGSFLASLEVLEPWWLLLLLVLPPLVWFSHRNLVSLGPVRRWVAVGLRCLLIALLAFALAETHARRPDKNLTVLFLWDRSLSIPPEYVAGSDQDVREQRLFQFINDAVLHRGPDRQDDRVGVIVFGKRPRLELPPGEVPELRFRKVLSQVDDTYTDIAGALKLALASFPEGTGKRIVLMSDGNENLGQAEEQARLAVRNGVQIDVVPIASGRRSANEVLVERVETPPQSDKDARVPLRVVLRSFHPDVVAGTLHLTKTDVQMKKGPDGAETATFVPREAIKPRVVKLRQGLNVFYLQQPPTKRDDVYTFEAKFVPLHVETAAGARVLDGLPGDRIENNRASTSVMARGERAVLFVEPNVGDHRLLVDRLRVSRPSLKIVTVTPAALRQNPAELALQLSKFDLLVLANVPADDFSEEQQKVIRSNTHDQGCGLLMIGGPQSFGAGAWQNTEVEKALPVTMDIKSMKVESKGGLVLMMHASEMAEGNAWQRKIAQLAVEKLSPMDMIGMIYWDWGPRGGHQWHIPFQQIGNQRGAILGLVNSMQPGDMPDADPAFVMAHKELTRPEYELGTKHIIFISDGDHWGANPALLRRIKDAKITCTTVCITTHGKAEIDKMRAVAQLTGGRDYHIKDPAELPAIYIKETRLISQSFVHESCFPPQLVRAGGPVEGLANPLPDLHGFVRTTARPEALVEAPILTPKLGEHTFPILAHWQYGLGKGVAFTSDARTRRDLKEKLFWDNEWASSQMYTQFWEQTVDYALRALDTGKYVQLTTEQRDGKIRLTLEARDENKLPITGLLNRDEKKGLGLRVGITSPSFKGADLQELRFEQTNSGVYEAEIPAEEVGSYFLNVQARWQQGDKEFADGVRAAVTIPYSPEFAEMESNASLLTKLSKDTGGRAYSEDAAALTRAAVNGELFRPVPFSHSTLQTLWPWFVFLTGLLLLLDVAVRRIAVEPALVWHRAAAAWARLRGRQVAESPTELMERLQSRKAAVGESIAREKAGRRFEVAEGAPATGPAVPTAVPTAGPDRPAPRAVTPPLAPAAKEEEPADYASRLMRAKKRAMEEREKNKDKPS